ncbi:MAG: thioredoxin family protein [Chloroflexi bacterium]|nr:thioredoxin family protein [Chloroflexota bacterium]MBI4198586.1 thioredoxin family protein [Chloroflexota bacterium]
MATSKTSVVTPQRFASGLSYKEYIAQITVNADRFEQYYATGKPAPEDAEYFKKAMKHPNGPAKMLALAEDWCPDVYRGLPVVARLAEATGLELRVFPRDKHLDIMAEFLNQGQFQSVPTVVFYTKDDRYIGHWIERPAFANKDRAEIDAQVRKELPNADDQAIRAEVRTRTTARYPLWQQESVKEIRELIASKTSIK